MTGNYDFDDLYRTRAPETAQPPAAVPAYGRQHSQPQEYYPPQQPGYIRQAQPPRKSHRVRNVVLAAVGAVALVAASVAGTLAFSGKTSHHTASASATPAHEVHATTADTLCAQALVVAMRAGLNHSTVNSANVTAAQQTAEDGLLVCDAVIKLHGEGLDPAVWALTAAAGFPRSKWDQ